MSGDGDTGHAEAGGADTGDAQTRARGAREGIRVGRIGRVPVILQPTWFLVAAVITFVFAPTVQSELPDGGAVQAYAVAAGFAVLLLVSVLVHEVAHALAAGATGTPATRIVLDLWGGHTSFGTDSRTPWRSILVAAVGPLSNGALWLLAVSAGDLWRPDGVLGLLLWATALANLFVALFNALPGLPLDGGRVLEGIVWQITGDRTTGTVVAGYCGRVVAVVVALWALYRGGQGDLTSLLWLFLVAGVLWQGAGQAVGYARWQRRATRASVRGLLRPAVAVPTSTSVRAAAATAAEAGAGSVVVLDVYGRPAAVVDENAAAAVPVDRADAVPVTAVAHALPHGAVVDVGLTGPALLQRLQAGPAARYAVLDGDRVVGVLDWDDVAGFVGA